jgi:hypothetical protein
LSVEVNFELKRTAALQGVLFATRLVAFADDVGPRPAFVERNLDGAVSQFGAYTASRTSRRAPSAFTLTLSTATWLRCSTMRLSTLDVRSSSSREALALKRSSHERASALRPTF